MIFITKAFLILFWVCIIYKLISCRILRYPVVSCGNQTDRSYMPFYVLKLLLLSAFSSCACAKCCTLSSQLSGFSQFSSFLHWFGRRSSIPSGSSCPTAPPDWLSLELISDPQPQKQFSRSANSRIITSGLENPIPGCTIDFWVSVCIRLQMFIQWMF